MTQRQILTHYNALLNDMFKQHTLFCETQDAEALHQLRLDYKKLNALLLFFTEDRKKCVRTKEFKKLRKFYQRTGEVRDAQMSIKLLRNVEGTGSIIQKKKANELKQTAALMERYEKDGVVIEAAKARTEEFIIAAHNELLMKRFSAALQTITTDLAPEARNEENLHDTRKLIKRTGYAGRMLTPQLQQKLKLPFKAFKKTEDAIGQWHDEIVLAQYMQQHKAGAEVVATLQQAAQLALQKAEKHISAFLKTA